MPLPMLVHIFGSLPVSLPCSQCFVWMVATKIASCPRVFSLQGTRLVGHLLAADAAVARHALAQRCSCTFPHSPVIVLDHSQWICSSPWTAVFMRSGVGITLVDADTGSLSLSCIAPHPRSGIGNKYILVHSIAELAGLQSPVTARLLSAKSHTSDSENACEGMGRPCGPGCVCTCVRHNPILRTGGARVPAWLGRHDYYDRTRSRQGYHQMRISPRTATEVRLSNPGFGACFVPLVRYSGCSALVWNHSST